MQPLSYVDSNGLSWDAPAGAMVDGASIPQAFWSILGGPYEGKYRYASVLHDWYCDRRTRGWRAVDRMFYEAMRTSGVDEATAKAMYLAVVWAGPRWDSQAIYNNTLPPSQRPPHSSQVSGDVNAGIGNPSQLLRQNQPGSTSETIAVLPNLQERFEVMAKRVAESNPDLDAIDALAEEDPGNVVQYVPAPQISPVCGMFGGAFGC
jgi:hypothetical protein